jgi:hypothetical protein
MNTQTIVQYEAVIAWHVHCSIQPVIREWKLFSRAPSYDDGPKGLAGGALGKNHAADLRWRPTRELF